MKEEFLDIINLIKQSRSNAIRAINAELIDLYWSIGKNISVKIANAEWGDSVVSELARYIQHNEPEIKGFSDKNIWRMKQFYEAYRDFPKLSTLLREISWSHNLAIFSRCKTIEEKEFYLRLAKQESYSFRELDRQISSSLFERTMIGNTELPKSLNKTNPNIVNTFRDSYVFEFLSLSESHSERELQRGLIKQMRNFILELGKDFLFIGEEYKLQVGNSVNA